LTKVYCHVLMGHNVRIIHPVGCRCQLSGFKRSLCILYLILSALFAVSNHLSHFRIDWRHQRVPENPTAGIGYTPERLFGGGVGVVQGVYLPRHISRQELLLCGCPRLQALRLIDAELRHWDLIRACLNPVVSMFFSTFTSLFKGRFIATQLNSTRRRVELSCVAITLSKSNNNNDKHNLRWRHLYTVSQKPDCYDLYDIISPIHNNY